MKTNIEVVECSDCAFLRVLITNYREAEALLRGSKDPFVSRCMTATRRVMRRAVVMTDLKMASEALDIVMSLQHI